MFLSFIMSKPRKEDDGVIFERKLDLVTKQYLQRADKQSPFVQRHTQGPAEPHPTKKIVYADIMALRQKNNWLFSDEKSPPAGFDKYRRFDSTGTFE